MKTVQLFQSLQRILLIAVFAGGLSNPAPAQPKEFLVGNLLPVGRFDKNENGLELISSGCHFSFSFTGKECKIYTAIGDGQNSSYLQYEVDGQYQDRLKITGKTVDSLIIKLKDDGKHVVTIYKTTEAHSGPLFIKKIIAKDIEAVTPASIPLIEFIGNSITCGAAADPTEVPCGTGEYHDQHNAYFAYGPRVARELGADFLMSSVSGIGMYRNWNYDGPTLPQVYGKTDLQNHSRRLWDFRKFTPEIVSIALGTNDFSAGDGKTKRSPFNAKTFTEKYIEFVKLIKSKYPNCKIILLSSATIKGEQNKTFQQCLTNVQKAINQVFPNDHPVITHFLKEMTPKGCTGHPDVKDHEIIAGELIPVFKNLLE